MKLHRYVAEEIALDCQEGLLTRREAMRRLGLLGLTATVIPVPAPVAPTFSFCPGR